MKKFLLWLAIMAVYLGSVYYPTMELTRCIRAWVTEYGNFPNLNHLFWENWQMEITAIWIGFAGGTIIVGLLTYYFVHKEVQDAK